jgi:hypothetical protein
MRYFIMSQTIFKDVHTAWLVDQLTEESLVNENINSILHTTLTLIDHALHVKQPVKYQSSIVDTLAALRCYKHLFGTDGEDGKAELSVHTLTHPHLSDMDTVTTLKALMKQCEPQYKAEIRFLTKLLNQDFIDDYTSIKGIIHGLQQWFDGFITTPHVTS